MAAGWTIRVPESGTNSILDPSAESGVTTNYAAVAGATVTQDTTQARFGNYAYKVVLGAVNRGVSLTTGALSNAGGFVTFYVYGTITGALQVSQDAGANYNAASVIGGSTGAWVRYGVAIPQAQRNGSTATLIRDTLNDGTIYIDGVMDQALAYATTYIDGDQGPLYRWSGLRHGSTSTRDAQDRTGGRDQDLFTTYGINVEQMPGAGMPPIVNNQQPYALQPGSIFQSYKIQPRAMTLILTITNAMSTKSLASFHSQRKALINLLKPDAYRGAQPFVLGYQLANSGKYVYGAFRYDSGLGMGAVSGGANWIEQGGKVPVTVIANDPFWYEDSIDTTVLTLQTSLASTDAILARLNGLWSELGTGVGGATKVTAIAVDKQRNRIYIAGTFTTFNGVTVNRICYWNGTTAVAMDSGANGEVDCIAIAPNGDVWIGGTFTTIGTALTACKGIAKWSVSGSAWSIITNTATTFVECYALAVDTSGNLYAAGDWALYNGVAGTVDIFMYDGTTVTALGTGMNGIAKALLIDNDGTTVYVGGAFTTGNGVTINRVGKWNGSTFVAMGSGPGFASGNVLAMAQDRAGIVYIGGSTPNNLDSWNGTTLAATSTTPLTAVFSMALDRDNSLLYLGRNAGSPNIYNGSIIVGGVTDINLPGSPTIFALAVNRGDLYAGYDTTGTATAAAQTTVTNNGTANAFPTITIVGPSTAGNRTNVTWIENQSTGERLYFANSLNNPLIINGGEKFTINLLPGNKSITSDWRGNIPQFPTSSSDYAAWHLLPGANTISFIAIAGSGTTTGVSVLVHSQPRHHSLDGAAT